MQEYTDFIRGIARPAIALSIALSLVYCVTRSVVVPLWYQVFATALVAEWVLERAITRNKKTEGDENELDNRNDSESVD